MLTYRSEASADASVAGTELRWSPITIPRDAGPRVVDTPNEPQEQGASYLIRLAGIATTASCLSGEYPRPGG
ncbi:MAG: hypothetical protein ACYCST_19615 [Acidimicrobiales bacterium]